MCQLRTVSNEEKWIIAYIFFFVVVVVAHLMEMPVAGTKVAVLLSFSRLPSTGFRAETTISMFWM